MALHAMGEDSTSSSSTKDSKKRDIVANIKHQMLKLAKLQEVDNDLDGRIPEWQRTKTLVKAWLDEYLMEKYK
jgi:hypothetical protein